MSWSSPGVADLAAVDCSITPVQHCSRLFGASAFSLVAIALCVSALTHCGRTVASAGPCAEWNCDGHGRCLTDSEGEAVCWCDPGYASEDPLRCLSSQNAGDGEQQGDASTGGPTTRLVPKNVAMRLPMDLSDTAVVIGDDAYSYWVLNTDDGSIRAYTSLDDPSADWREIRRPVMGSDSSGIEFTTLPQGDGAPALGVFSLGQLELKSGAWAIGVGGRALVMLVASTAQVDGTLSVGADRLPLAPAPGAGGSAGGSGSGADALGYGGGSAALSPGASATGGSFGGTGGGGTPPYGRAELKPLLGGCGGGSGLSPGALGGHGGGALHLAANISITVGHTGRIDARGGGGKTDGSAAAGAGGAGGAGGAILLEAPQIIVQGFLAANGGAGASGNAAAGGGVAGQPGWVEQAPVIGPPASTDAGAGGHGSDAWGDATAGGDAPGNAIFATGGGGGGGGRIRVNTGDGTDVWETASILPTRGSGLATVGRSDERTTYGPCSSGPGQCVAEGAYSCVNGMLELEVCAVGCNADSSRCRSVLPSNVGATQPFHAASAALFVGGDAFTVWVFNTDDGSIQAYDSLAIDIARSRSIRPAVDGVDASGIFFTPVAQGADLRNLGVFAFDNLTIASNAQIIGQGTNALALFAHDTATIDGLLSVAAGSLTGLSTPGAGGASATPCRGGSVEAGAGGDVITGGHGAGGGGGAAPGGAGGGATGGVGGIARGTADLIPLVGGGAGGCSSRTSGLGLIVGHGGGAVQLSAGRLIHIGLGGVVNASGGGGARGGNSGGGGGGAGGAILIEAPIVEILGTLGANGGGGGGASCCDAGYSVPGTQGTADAVSAAGGSAAHGWTGAGGAGSDSNGIATPGYTGQIEGSGGGGGGGGRVRINTEAGTEIFPQARITPAPTSPLSTVGVLGVEE